MSALIVIMNTDIDEISVFTAEGSTEVNMPLIKKKNRSEYAAHKEKENERDKVAGNEHSLAANVHFELKSHAV